MIINAILSHVGHKPSRDCFIKWGLVSLTTIILFGIGLCLYWLVIDREWPVEIKRGEVVLYQEQPDHSWVFIVRWTGVLKRRCGGMSKRWIVDGFRLPLSDMPYPAEAEPTKIGEEFSWEVPVQVPAYFVSTGHKGGQYRAIFFHACNPLQERVFPIQHEPPVVPFSLPLDGVPVKPVPPPLPPPPRPRAEPLKPKSPAFPPPSLMPSMN